MVAEDLRSAWRSDDMLAWIMFLLFLLPMPFLYAYFENIMPDRSAMMHTVYTFAFTAVFWTGLYGLKNKLEDSGGDGGSGADVSSS